MHPNQRSCSISEDYYGYCRDLDEQRSKRDALKLLLDHAKRSDLSRWTEFLSAELTKVRTIINRLRSKKNRLKRRLPQPAL